MLRTVLVIVHAGSGVVGLLAGPLSLSPPKPGDGRGWLRLLYLVCIAILLVSLVVLIAVDWSDLEVAARIAFSGLTGLGAVMAYRIVRSRQEASVQAGDWQERYIGHVYFTYVSLWIGFVIIPALNLPLPQVTVPLVAIAALVIGNVLIARYKRRVLAA